MRPLEQCLLDIPPIHLEVIARYWGLEPPAGRNRRPIVRLAEAMARAGAVVAARDALPNDQRRALDDLLAAGGKMAQRTFYRRWGTVRPMGPARMERERPWEQPHSPAEGLWYHGFIFRAFAQKESGSYPVIFIPPELLHCLPAPPPKKITLPAPVPPPPHTSAWGDTLLDDCCTLLIYLHNEQVHPRPTGDWPPAHDRRLTQRLRTPHPDRLAFLRHLIRRLGWLRTAESGHLRPTPGPTTAWLQSPPGRQREALLTGWRDDPTWNDLFHIPTLLPEETGSWHNDPVTARRAILRHLTDCRPGAWYRLDIFLAAVKEADPDFQRPDGDYDSWYIRDRRTGVYLSGFEDWEQVEGRLIRYLISRPLAWLGVVETGAGHPAGETTHFRLTEAGAAALIPDRPREEPEEHDPPPLSLHPGHEVRVPAGRRYERFQLARVADRVGLLLRGDKATYRYRFTGASLTRARRQGITVTRILDFIAHTTGSPPPVPLREALTRWETEGEKTVVDLRPAILLQVADPGLLDDILAAPALRRLIGERLGPRTALVREQDIPALTTALARAGLLLERERR